MSNESDNFSDTPSVEGLASSPGDNTAFRLPSERIHTLKERVLHPLRRTDHRQHAFGQLDRFLFRSAARDLAQCLPEGLLQRDGGAVTSDRSSGMTEP